MKTLQSIIGKTATALTELHCIVNNAPAQKFGIIKNAYIQNRGTKDAKIILEVGNNHLTIDPADTVEFNAEKITFENGGCSIGYGLKVFCLNFI